MTAQIPEVQTLLNSLKSFYNIVPFESEPYLVARCDYFEKSQRFMVSKKANLWTADTEEFIYLFYTPHLTDNILQECMSLTEKSWPSQAHIGPDHMYTYVTPIFICQTCEDTVVKKIKKCRIYKSFKLSFYGWMEYHTALLCNNRIFSNSRGKCVKKMLEKVFQLNQA